MKYKYHLPDGEIIIHRVSLEGNYKTPLMSISELSKVLHIDRETLTKRIKKHKVTHRGDWRRNRLFALHEVAKIAWLN